MDSKPLIIFGTSEIAQLARYYFENDGGREVAAFTVDDEFRTSDTIFERPLVSFATLDQTHPPDRFDLFVAISYQKVNRLREQKFNEAKSKGYHLPSYVSTRASVLNDHRIGDNCFILEDNTIQPFCVIGDNVTLWSGNHIGHHSVIEDHCFISSHVVVSGSVRVRHHTFIGVNATIRNAITIAESNVIGAGALILKDTEPEQVFISAATEASKVPSSRLRGI
jgi:sugar O-acyltransferase (sialic acid O-acetyltransferase NeuD family)